jgi:FkbM family methyltransferase
VTERPALSGPRNRELTPTAAQKLVIEINHRFGLGNGALRKYGAALLEALRDGPLDYEYFGLQLRFFPPLRRTAHMLLSPGWSERRERAFIEKHLPPTGMFLDIGANVGYYTFFVAGRRPHCHVVSIEPIQDYAAMLEFNRRLNRLDRVAIEEVALSDREGAAQFDRATESMVFGAGTAAVNTVTLLHLLASRCMKIDVEGAEDRVLMPFFRSAAKSLWPKALLMEHACRTHWKEDCLAFALANGYRAEFRNTLNTGLALAT